MKNTRYDLYGPDTNKYSLYGPLFKTDTHGTYARMRDEDPVCPHIEEGRRKWFISHYDDVIAVLHDHQHFIKDYRRLSDQPVEELDPTQDVPLERIFDVFFTKNLLRQDEPEHSRLRSLVNKAFAPRLVNQMEGTVQQIADSLLDSFQDRGAMDVVQDFAFPLSVAVIAGILGVSAEDKELFREAAEALITPRETEADVLRSYHALAELKQYLERAFAERRAQPQDDLLTHLVQARAAGDKLSEVELYSLVAEMISAGHETTVHLVGNGILALLQHPDQLDKLKQDPSLIGKAVEEILRYDCPVDRSTPRFAAEDIEFRGQTIQRGEQVVVVISSANRDAAQFADPHTFDIARADNRHIAFGVGIHYCLGSALSRLEGRIAIGTLVRRLANIQLNTSLDALEWHTIPLVRGLKNLPITWDVNESRRISDASSLL